CSRLSCFFSSIGSAPPPSSALFPYTTLFRSPAAVLLLPLPAAVPGRHGLRGRRTRHPPQRPRRRAPLPRLRGARAHGGQRHAGRSEEHTSELQSRFDLVCRLLLEKKK